MENYNEANAIDTLGLIRGGFYNSMRPSNIIIDELLQVIILLSKSIDKLDEK